MFDFRRITLLGMTALLMAFQFSACFAASVDEIQKPTVAVLFVNNAKTTYDEDLNKKVMDNFKTVLQDKYIVLAGGPFLERLNKQGFSDITSAEFGDIIDVVKKEDVDYIVYAELQPFNKKQLMTFFTVGVSMTAVMPARIIGVKESKSYYNGKFVETAREDSAIGGVGNKTPSMKALDLIFTKLNAVLLEKLPAVLPVIKPATPIQPAT